MAHLTSNNSFRPLPFYFVKPAIFKTMGSGVEVSFARYGRFQAQSFPRRRESNPSAAHIQWLAEWIPAFAGMTRRRRFAPAQKKGPVVSGPFELNTAERSPLRIP